jgi:hypothetical protein
MAGTPHTIHVVFLVFQFFIMRSVFSLLPWQRYQPTS